MANDMYMMFDQSLGRMLAIGTKQEIDLIAKEYMLTIEMMNNLKKQKIEDVKAQMEGVI